MCHNEGQVFCCSSKRQSLLEYLQFKPGHPKMAKAFMLLDLIATFLPLCTFSALVTDESDKLRVTANDMSSRPDMSFAHI